MRESTSLLKILHKPIISCLEKKIIPWAVPEDSPHAWKPLDRPLKSTEAPFEGINVLVMWAESLLKGFRSAYWFTEAQAKSRGASIKSGEESTQLIMFPRGERSGSLYAVYNAEQLQDIPRRFLADPMLFHSPPADQCELSRKFLKAVHPAYNEGVDIPYYLPEVQEFRIPNRKRFRDDRDFYAMWCHVLQHKAGTENPDTGWKSYPRTHSRYVISELVASMGGAYLATSLGIPARVMPEQQQKYLHYWLDFLDRYPEELGPLRKTAAATTSCFERYLSV